MSETLILYGAGEGAEKRLVESVAGRGGLEAIVQFADQLDWVEGLQELRTSIKNKTVFFETAISKCSREMLKRPLAAREEDVFAVLGVVCLQCGFQTTLWHGADKKCPQCGSAMEKAAPMLIKQLVAQKLEPLPEAILMAYAFDRLADAYVDAYKAMGLILKSIAGKFGWQQYRVNPQMLSYIHAYFYGRMAGEQKVSREEKESLQFITRGNLAGIPFEEAEKLLRIAVAIVKYGYLFQVLGVKGAYHYYQQLVPEFGRLYDQLNAQIRSQLGKTYVESRRRAFKVKKVVGGYYVPFLLMPKQHWVHGSPSGEIPLEPAFIDVFPKADRAAVQTVLGPQGSGKTVILSAIACYSIQAKRSVVIVPLNDKSNSYSLAGLPMFAYSRRTFRCLEILRRMEVEPQGVPCITVAVVKPDEKIDETQPPTIYDRILEVEDYSNFQVDFNMLLNELKAVAENYGYSQPVGMIAFRNLQRVTQKTYVDVVAASNVLLEFDRWRKSHTAYPMRILLDEISYMASAQAILYAGDKMRAAATVGDFIKESRRNAVAVDAATQLYLEVVPIVRNESTSIFFRNLPASKEKTRSQIDYLLESIQLRDETLKPIIRERNNQGFLQNNLWFWYHKPSYSIDIVRPIPPTFCILDPEAELSTTSIVKRYEKETGRKILLKSWKEVPVISKAARTKQPKTSRSQISF